MNIIRRGHGDVSEGYIRDEFFLCYNEGNAFERDKLTQDILLRYTGIGCVVNYIEKYEDVDTVELEKRLSGMRALILCVTKEMLQTFGTDREPYEYRFAKANEIPMIPVVMDETRLPELTLKTNETIHGFAHYDKEMYHEMLYQQLSLYALKLPPYATSEDVNHGAFSGKVFLSYRKDNFNEAVKFIRWFHSFPEFQSVSVWFDMYLMAGQKYDVEINSKIKDCDLFVLLVTPELLEKSRTGDANYVEKVEYPLACELGKNIISVEAIATDENRLAAQFSGAEPISLDDGKTLYSAFRQYFNPPDSMAAEQLHLLGEAYTEGLGVLKDTDIAAKFYTEAAADTDSIWAYHATVKLIICYKCGILEDTNNDKMLKWAQRLGELTFAKTIDNGTSSLVFLGQAYYDRAEYEQSLKYSIMALDALKERDYKTLINDFDFISSWNIYTNIGRAYTAMEEYIKALEYHNKILWCLRQAPDPSIYDEKVAITYFDLGEIYFNIEDYKKTFECYNEASRIQLNLLGEEHFDTLNTHLSMIRAYLNNDLADIVCEMLAKNYAIAMKTLIVNSPLLQRYHDTVETLICMMSINDYTAKQSDSYLRIIEMFEQKANKSDIRIEVLNRIEVLKSYISYLLECEHQFGENSVQMATVFFNHGKKFMEIENFFDAKALFEKSLLIRQETLGHQHPSTVEAYKQTALACSLIGLQYGQSQQYEEAVEYFEYALVIMRKVPSYTEIAFTGVLHRDLGIAYFQKGDYYNSQSNFWKASKVYSKVYGVDHPETIQAYVQLEKVYLELGDQSISSGKEYEALKFFEAALDIDINLHGETNDRVIALFKLVSELNHNLGEDSLNIGKTSDALEYFKKSFILKQRILGENHPETIELLDIITKITDGQK